MKLASHHLKSDHSATPDRKNGSMRSSNDHAQMQQVAGNQAVQGLFAQTMLKVGSVDDPYEQEADRVASQVMRQESSGSLPAITSIHPQVSRKCDECSEKEKTPFTLQRKSHNQGSAGHAVSASRLSPALQGGRSLGNETRAFFESRFGRSFGDIKVHTGGYSNQVAQSLDAKAFTTGKNIVFAAGQYQPDTFEGRHLLAHELTHVIQQSRCVSIAPDIQRQASEPDNGEAGKTSAGHGQQIKDAIGSGDYSEAFKILNGLSMSAMLKTLAGIASIMHANRQQAHGVNMGRIDAALIAVMFGTVCRSRPGWMALPEDQKQTVYAYLKLDTEKMLRVDRDREQLLVRMSGDSFYVVQMSDVRDKEQDTTCPPPGPPSSAISDPDQAIIDSLFAALGVGAGETITVDPGHSFYLAAVVKLMEQQGASFNEARDYVLRSLGLDTSDINQEQGGWNEQQGEKDGTHGFVPPGMPPWLWHGIQCHRTIGAGYAGANPGTLLDTHFTEIVRLLGHLSSLVGHGPPTAELSACYLMRPDIFDAPKQQIYEIKSQETGAAAAAGEALAYKKCFDAAKLPGVNITLGSPANPGTTGAARDSNGRWCIWTCPTPGAIVYESLLPMENPNTALERLIGETRNAPQVGVEVITAIAILGAVGFAELIAVLGAPAGAAPAAAPALAPAPAKLAPILLPATGAL